MPEPATPPVIIEPFSTFGDTVAGATADEVAHHLAAATRTSLAWRCKLRRPCPDVRALFSGHRLSEQARQDLRDVEAVYTRESLRQRQPVAPPPVAAPTTEQPELTLF